MVKIRSKWWLLAMLSVLFYKSVGQSAYSTTSWELILGMADVKVGNQQQETGLKPSFLLNLGEQWHTDFNPYMGMYMGGNIRNMGFKIKENDRKDVHRVLSAGLPVAIKLGFLDKHLYVYGGGEIEYFFHYKHRRNDDGNRIKTSKWFSNKTNNLMPSAFVGLQLPKGLNVRFSYLLRDFFNPNFEGLVLGENIDFSQWKTQVYYISVSLNFKKGAYKHLLPKNEGQLVRL
jgi:hypothetical protein